MTTSKLGTAAAAAAVIFGILLGAALAASGGDSGPRKIEIAPREAVSDPAEPSTTVVAPVDAQPTTTAPSGQQAGPGPVPAPTAAPAPAPQPSTTSTTCHLSSIPTNPNGTPAGPPQQICGP